MLGAQFDSDSGGVVFSCDMHGHSRNMNVFMYACKNLNEDPLISRVPNQIISSIPESVVNFCPIFSLKECKMAVEKDKETTGLLTTVVVYVDDILFFGNDKTIIDNN